jgi:putative colanic acid biosynthesis acetyltransferase WcaF
MTGPNDAMTVPAASAPWSLRAFRGDGYDKGRPVIVQAAWFVVLNLVFVKWWCPPALRVVLLRWFGAAVGSGVLIRHRVRVMWPWKLRVGDDVWIGEDAWLINLEPIEIGPDCCISQAAHLISGSHDRRSPSFEFDNAPVLVESGCWIATGALVLRGVKVGAGSVIGAGAVVARDVEPGSLVRR